MKPSPGIMLLWRFAGAEAERSGHEFIEPEHFFEAMTRGESLTDDTMLRLVIAAEAGSDFVQAPHLFLAIMREKDSHLAAAIQAGGGNQEGITKAIAKRLKVAIPAGEMRDAGEPAPDNGTPWLDRYGRDLTAEARAGKLGPVIGRRKGILQVLQTLARSTKNNPVLIGGAGVGKTAIVEALAIRIAEGKDQRARQPVASVALATGWRES